MYFAVFVDDRHIQASATENHRMYMQNNSACLTYEAIIDRSVGLTLLVHPVDLTVISDYSFQL